MKLYHSPASPYVRKVMVVAQETGLLDRIEVATITTTPMQPDPGVAAANPVQKIPALVTDDGMTLFDSPVICEYLDSLHTGAKMFPEGKARWQALRLQAAADGMLDAALLVVYEARFRDEAMRNKAWTPGTRSSRPAPPCRRQSRRRHERRDRRTAGRAPRDAAASRGRLLPRDLP
jgi:glutathione S-transferase